VDNTTFDDGPRRASRYARQNVLYDASSRYARQRVLDARQETSHTAARLDEGALRDALLAVEGLEELGREVRARVGHRERGRARAVLGLDDLVACAAAARRASRPDVVSTPFRKPRTPRPTAEHDAVRERVDVLRRERGAGHLGQQRQDGRARVAADDRDLRGEDVRALVLRDEGLGLRGIKVLEPFRRRFLDARRGEAQLSD